MLPVLLKSSNWLPARSLPLLRKLVSALTSSALSYLEVTSSTWIRMGDLSAQLLRKGVTLPLSDLLIAVLAIEYGCRLYSLDTHFKKIPGVTLYPPARA
jgi:predicted nucleic acid-binding protein